MKRFATALLIAAATALLPMAAAEAGLEEGRAHYARGDFAVAGARASPGTARALYWTRQAAEQGDGPAPFNLANMYETGDTIAKDLALAAKYYEAAAHAGIPLAQYRLGAYYLAGAGGVRDVVLAFVWHVRAAANENADEHAAHAAKERYKVARSLTGHQKQRGTALLDKNDTRAEQTKPRKRSTGAGFIVSADGYILTNNHVVAGCAEVRIKPLVVPVVARDAERDLALLKVSAAFKRFSTFRASDIRKGESVVVAGFPLPGVLASDLKVTAARNFLAANGVTPVTASSSKSLEPADVAERAQFYTALIECWK